MFVITGTDNAESVQIIIPAREINRKNDIYVAMVSNAHMVAAKGKYIAIVSTAVESNRPIAELNAGVALLGPILERFDSVTDLLAPVGDGTRDKCFISRSYDATRYVCLYVCMCVYCVLCIVWICALVMHNHDHIVSCHHFNYLISSICMFFFFLFKSLRDCSQRCVESV